MADKKTYGLILPKKPGQSTSKVGSAFNIFGNESDEEGSDKLSKISSKKSLGSTVKRQTQMDIDRALQEDPTVYEYDSIYDDLQASKPHVGTTEKSTAEKKPKYITGLLKAAEKRKKEDERRKERLVQKEREAEGEMFADKEKFVTSAYKQKMIEMAEAEEKEKQEAAMENLLDVTKQKDMSGFYRYLYRSTTDGEPQPIVDTKENIVKQEMRDPESTSSPHHNIPSSPRQHRSPSSASSSDSESSRSSDKDSSAKTDKVEFSKPNRPGHGGKFRQHRSNSSSSPEPGGKKHPQRPESSHRDRKQRGGRDSHEDSGSSRRVKKSRSRSPVTGLHNRSQRSVAYAEKLPHRTRSKERSRSPDRNKAKPAPDKKQKDLHKKESERTNKDRSILLAVKETSPVAQETSKRTSSAEKENQEVVKKDKKTCDAENKSVKEVPVALDPRNKVYPHHNSAKDIAEARKRYLQRKIAREMSA